ncbi:hypothetical protein [Aureimonas sp. AU40]|uniref:hypothetical protein n=1 Tax=Aureimonas sp. AU40 TaxID=1637747 RepID=UPI0012E3EF44|nr:hypothetical protein [Aureimonas sp. AU40]
MTASDIVTALEAGLITENEAMEQAMVDRLADLYEHQSSSPRWRSQRAQGVRAAGLATR